MNTDPFWCMTNSDVMVVHHYYCKQTMFHLFSVE